MSDDRMNRPTGQAWTMERGSGQVPARMRTRAEIQREIRVRRELEAAVEECRRPITLEELAHAVATGCSCWETCSVLEHDRPEPATVPELAPRRAAGGRVALVDFRPVAIVEPSPYADCWGEGR